MKKIDILYSADRNFIDIMSASILSLITNSDVEDITLHIITSQYEETDYKKIEELVHEYSNIKVNFYPMEDFNIEKYHLPSWRGTQIANSRLFFQDILKPHLSTISNLLYLDSDTLVVSSLTDLEEYNTKTISAVKDSISYSYFSRLDLKKYYNSGVIYINIDEWIKNKCQESLIKTIETTDKKLILPDQDILNCALQNKITELPLNYNLNPYTYLFEGILSKLYFNEKIRIVTHEEVIKAKTSPIIIHTSGLANIKPWHENTINPFNDEFMEYIIQVNPNFEKLPLSSYQQLLNDNPLLLKYLLVAKNYFPPKVSEVIRTTSNKLQTNSKVKQKSTFYPTKKY